MANSFVAVLEAILSFCSGLMSSLGCLCTAHATSSAGQRGGTLSNELLLRVSVQEPLSSEHDIRRRVDCKVHRPRLFDTPLATMSDDRFGVASGHSIARRRRFDGERSLGVMRRATNGVREGVRFDGRAEYCAIVMAHEIGKIGSMSSLPTVTIAKLAPATRLKLSTHSIKLANSLWIV